MAERSRARRRTEFSRGRLFVGLLLVCVLAGGVAYGLGRLRSAPDPGRVMFATTDAIYEYDLATGTERRVLQLPDGTAAAVVSPDGEWIAYARGAGEVWLAGINEETRFQVADKFTTPLGWAPDGRLIAGEILSDGDLVAVGTDGKREVLMTGGYVRGSIPVWLDDDRFAIAKNDDEFVVIENSEPTATHDGRILAASPGGRELLWQDEKAIYVGDIEGESSAIFEGTAEQAATSPDGYVAISTKNGIWMFEGGTTSRRVAKARADWLGWARTGPIVVYAADGVIYARDLREGSPKRITGRDKKVRSLFSFVVTP